ncbi:MAG: class I SAM-dependent methyltransferase [Candidatus Poseidoniaceae archaeon]
MNARPSPTSGWCVPRHEAEKVRDLLEAVGSLDRRWRPSVEGDRIIWPLLEGATVPQGTLGERIAVAQDAWAPAPPPMDPHRRVHDAMTDWLREHHDDAASHHGALLNDLPQRWERLGDLVLLPSSSFGSSAWQERFASSEARPWACLAIAFKAVRLGLQNVVASDTVRSSGATMLLGDHGKVDMLDHGVRFRFDATQQMFSSGNVTERRRMGDLDLRGETVVDAFSGIGYYTLPMLVRAGAEHVHACDINPEAAAWLLEGARCNGVEDRLSQHLGDNRNTLPELQGVADRVVLGLLPSSEHAWEDAVGCLKPNGGWLHVHMNVKEERIEAWAEETAAKLGGVVGHIERVKWYAPRIRHVVLDLHIS